MPPPKHPSVEAEAPGTRDWVYLGCTMPWGESLPNHMEWPHSASCGITKLLPRTTHFPKSSQMPNFDGSTAQLSFFFAVGLGILCNRDVGWSLPHRAGSSLTYHTPLAQRQQELQGHHGSNPHFLISPLTHRRVT